MNLCYYHFVHDNCRFGDRCKWSHETPTPPYTDHFMCSGANTRKPVDTFVLRYIDPEVMDAHKRRELEEYMDLQIRIAEANAKEAEQRQRAERRKKDRLEWDELHPTKIIVAVTNHDMTFRWRAPVIQLTEPFDYILFQSIRFNDRWFESAYPQSLRVYEIEIREGDTTDLGFVQLDRIDQALCLYTLMPLELIEIVYRFIDGATGILRHDWGDDGYGSY